MSKYILRDFETEPYYTIAELAFGRHGDKDAPLRAWYYTALKLLYTDEILEDRNPFVFTSTEADVIANHSDFCNDAPLLTKRQFFRALKIDPRYDYQVRYDHRVKTKKAIKDADAETIGKELIALLQGDA